MTIGELIINLGFKADEKKLRDFTSMLGDLNLSSVLTAAGLGGVFKGVEKVIDISRTATDRMHGFQIETGLSAEKMKAWSNAAEQVGASKGAVEGTLRAIHSMQQRFLLTRELPQSFLGARHMLAEATGVVLPLDADDPFEFLKTLREGLKEFPTAQRSMLMDMLGISSEMLRFLTMSEEQWKNIERAMIPSYEMAEKLVESGGEMTRFLQDLSALMSTVGVKLSSLIGPFLGVASDEIRELNKGLQNTNGLLQDISALSDTFNLMRAFGLPRISVRDRGAIVQNTFNIETTDPRSAADEVGRIIEEQAAKSLYDTDPGDY